MLFSRIIRSLILQRSESDYCCCCFRSYPFVFENCNFKVRGITSQRWRSTILLIDECRLFSVNLVQCIIILESHLPTAYSWRFLLLSYPVGNVRSYNDAWLSSREVGNQVRIWFGLMLNVPVNNFSIMFGRSHRFLCITSFFFFFGGGIWLLKDTTRQLEWGSNPRLLDPESEVLTTR